MLWNINCTHETPPAMTLWAQSMQSQMYFHFGRQHIELKIGNQHAIKLYI